MYVCIREKFERLVIEAIKKVNLINAHTFFDIVEYQREIKQARVIFTFGSLNDNNIDDYNNNNNQKIKNLRVCKRSRKIVSFNYEIRWLVVA